MKKSTIITASALAIAIGGAGITAAVMTSQPAPEIPVAQTQTPQVVTASDEIQSAVEETANGSANTEDLLLYLIEEEKLAHDVYTVLGDAWGGNTFSNILASETTHQSQVLTLLTKYGLADPRSAEIGVFTNPDLQALYDQLIAQGQTSQTEAYKVGVLIEETDIVDLTAAISSTTDPTVISTLEKLSTASENHLAAFRKKI